jgi:N-methylhydantoinase B/oxoprolinase/acetone carboxylase alpha subunit
MMMVDGAVDAISLAVFRSLFASVAEEMGATLQRASFSPNIKERLDFSCALFDGRARMVAQAAHIPVHLGSMPASVAHALRAFEVFRP